MAAINDIVNTISSLYVEGGQLEISSNVFSESVEAEIVIAGFLEAAFDGSTLTLIGTTSLEIGDDGQSVSVSGSASYLNFDSLVVQLSFEAGEGDSIEIGLIGTLASQTPTLPVIDWIVIQNAAYNLVYNSEALTIRSFYSGTLGVIDNDGDPQSLNLSLALEGIGGEAWSIEAASIQGNEISAADQLIWLLSGNDPTSFFPAGIPVLDNVLLDSVYARFQPANVSLPIFSVDFIYDQSWNLVTTSDETVLLGLKAGMRFGLSLNDYFDDTLRRTVGTILATFELGGIDVPVFLQADLSGNWLVGIQEFDPVILPSISNLMTMISPAAAEELPAGLLNIPGIEIDKMFIGFNPVTPSFDSFEFAIQTTSTWAIIPDYFEIEQFAVGATASQIYPTGNLTWSFTLTAGFRIGEVWLSCNLEKPTSGDWVLTATIPQNHPLTIRAMAETLMPGSDIPDGVPDFGIVGDPYLFQVTFGDETTFAVQAKSNDSWEIVEGLTFNDFAVDFNYAGNNQISGSASASFDVLGVTFAIDASLDNSANGGWTFRGSAELDQTTIGSFVSDMASALGMDAPTVPTPIASAVISSEVLVTYETRTKDFNFHAEVELSGDLSELKMELDVQFKHNADGSYEDLYRGTLTLTPDENNSEASLLFQVEFLDSTTEGRSSDTFFAVFHDSGGAASVDIGSLVGLLDSTLGAAISSIGLEMDLHDVIFVGQNDGQPGSTTKFVFGLNWDLGLNLSNLPLVGQLLAPDQTMSVDFQVLVASQTFSKDETVAINRLLPEASTPLPEDESGIIAWDSEDPEPKPLSTKINLGGDALDLDLPVWISGSSSSPGLTTNDSDVVGNRNPTPLQGETNDPRLSGGSVNDGLHWFKIEKSWGPVYLDRIGGTVADGNVTFGLGATLSMLGLEVTLDGLTITNPLTSFGPSFGLNGLGIGYHVEGIGLQGALLRQTLTDANGTYDVYNGGAVLTIPELTLAALGSYATLPPQTLGGVTIPFVPSLFVYAVLDAPLFGQPYFFLNGLAAGFGFNRDLIAPTIDHVYDFPLVSVATGGAAATSVSALESTLNDLNVYMPPQVGQVFLALGIKFSSFNLVDCFALMTVAVGTTRIEADLLGLGTAVLPTPVGTPVPPLAEVQIELLARIAPMEGVVSVEAQLTPNSYIFTRDCHLTGGFALMAWYPPLGGGATNHLGEFVLSLGGYHPDFHRDYYPVVPRLGFRWQVTKEISIKGEAYCSLTPLAMMAGGRMEATFEDGGIRAWFIANADFFIGWQPFHYTADMSIDVGGSYHFDHWGVSQTVGFDIGADLTIWGPDFSGKAKVNYSVVTFTIAFGAAKKTSPPALDWDDFQTAFLPQFDEGSIETNYGSIWLNITASSGILSTDPDATDTSDLGVVSPQELVLNVGSSIPLQQVDVTNWNGAAISTGAEFGIRPMKISGATFSQNDTSTLQISITYSNGSEINVENEFEIEAVFDNLPAAMWDPSTSLSTHDLDAPDTVPNLLTGLCVKPAAPVYNNPTKTISDADLISYQVTPHAFAWQAAKSWVNEDLDSEARAETIVESLADTDGTVAQTRQQLLDTLGIPGMTVDVSDQLVAEFREIPVVAN